jgi:hypothetical protein
MLVHNLQWHMMILQKDHLQHDITLTTYGFTKRNLLFKQISWM